MAAAIAAVGIAIWSNRKTRQRVDAEHTFGQGQLDRQLEASREQLAAEQAFSRRQLDEEHEAAQELEQLAEAALVEVALAVRDVPLKTDEVYDEAVGPVQKRLGVMVVNHGRYAITRVEAQFSFQGNDLRAAVKSSRRPREQLGLPAGPDDPLAACQRSDGIGHAAALGQGNAPRSA